MQSNAAVLAPDFMPQAVATAQARIRSMARRACSNLRRLFHLQEVVQVSCFPERPFCQQFVLRLTLMFSTISSAPPGAPHTFPCDLRSSNCGASKGGASSSTAGGCVRRFVGDAEAVFLRIGVCGGGGVGDFGMMYRWRVLRPRVVNTVTCSTSTGPVGST